MQNYKNPYVRNHVKTTIIKHCRSEERGIRAIDGFKKKKNQ